MSGRLYHDGGTSGMIPVAMGDVEIRAVDGGVTLRVRVKPRASRSRVLGEREGALEVAVAAPPVDGEANRELVHTLAKHLGVPRSAVLVEAGEASRLKRVRVDGLTVAEALAKTSPRD